MLYSFLNASNFSYKMDTHFTVINNQIEIPGHLNYVTYQLEGSWTDNYGKLGTIFCNGETKIPKSNLVEIFGICEITDEDKNKRWWTINRDKSEIEKWLDKDPIKLIEKYMSKKNKKFIFEKEKIISKINLEIKKSFNYAKNSKFPSSKRLKEHLYG